MLELLINQGNRQQSLLIAYDQLDQLNIPKMVPGCTYLERGARAEIIKQIRLSVSRALQNGVQNGTWYEQSGWFDSLEGKLFVAGGDVISEKGINESTDVFISKCVAQLHLAVDNTLTPTQSCELLLRELAEYGNYKIPAFSYTLYSMLHSIWPSVNLPAACVLNLVGTQGYGKSTLARNFCALYNHSTGQISDFYDAQSTPASMRNALSSSRDRCVVIDDICNSISIREMQKRRDLAGHILRNAANETPVAKMEGDETVNYICESGLVLTGELPLDVPSDVTRCIIINVSHPLRNGDPNIRSITATSVAAYIQWLCANFTEEMDYIKRAYHAFSEKDVQKNLWRLKTSLFQLDWAFSSFLRFARNIGAISETAQQQFENHSSDIAQSIFSYEEGIVQRIEHTQPSNWKQLIISGAHKMAFPYKQKPGCVCVKPSDLTDFLRSTLHNPALQEQEIIKTLKTQGLLLMDKSGKSTKKVSGIRMLNINLLK